MELNREQIINELDTQLNFAKFTKSNGVLLSAKCAQFCLEHIQYYEQKIKELTEENERLRALRTVDKEYKYCNLLYDALIYTKTLEDYNRLRAGFRADTVRKFADKLKGVFPSIAGALDYFEKELLEG